MLVFWCKIFIDSHISDMCVEKCRLILLSLNILKASHTVITSAVQYFHLLNRHRINIDYEYLLIPTLKINIKNRFWKGKYRIEPKKLTLCRTMTNCNVWTTNIRRQHPPTRPQSYRWRIDLNQAGGNLFAWICSRLLFRSQMFYQLQYDKWDRKKFKIRKNFIWDWPHTETTNLYQTFSKIWITLKVKSNLCHLKQDAKTEKKALTLSS